MSLKEALLQNGGKRNFFLLSRYKGDVPRLGRILEWEIP